MLKRVLSAAILAVGAQSVAALEVIVDRSEDSIELFLRLGAEQVQPLFNVTSGAVMRDDAGALLTPVFQLEGSEAQAAHLISNMETTMGADAVTFEPMSMMLHPATLEFDFFEPFNGWMYMSACSVPPPTGFARDEDLQLVAGYSAYPVDGTRALTIALSGDSSVDVTVLEFFKGRQISENTLNGLEDGQIVLEGPVQAGFAYAWIAAAGALLVSVPAIWRRRNKVLKV